MASFESEAAKRIDILEKTTRKLQARNVPDFYMGYTNMPVLPAYASATSVTFTGIDLTAHFTIGVKCAWYQSAGWRYGYVLSSSFGSGNTTLNFVANTSHSVANTDISTFKISYGNPPDFPGWLNWTPNISGMTVVGTPTYTGIFSINGKTVYGQMELQSTTSLAAAGSGTTCPVPVTGSTGNMFVVNWTNDFAVELAHSLLVANDKIFFITWTASARKFVASFFYNL
jgi:hypothetical protein